jgi:hypothetical protein
MAHPPKDREGTQARSTSSLRDGFPGGSYNFEDQLESFTSTSIGDTRGSSDEEYRTFSFPHSVYSIIMLNLNNLDS